MDHSFMALIYWSKMGNQLFLVATKKVGPVLKCFNKTTFRHCNLSDKIGMTWKYAKQGNILIRNILYITYILLMFCILFIIPRQIFVTYILYMICIIYSPQIWGPRFQNAESQGLLSQAQKLHEL